jgi:cyclophilin family peptidyl-prolyl cis-trans isomerase
MIQGGDVLYNNGFGTTSIYGKTFVDEHFHFPHDRPGVLSMANAGPDTNGSQFFITTAPAPHLNGRHVAFGQVVAGFDIVKEIEENGSPDGRPRAQIWITDSGDLNESGFLMEVQYERARLEQRILQEQAKDVEEIRIYNECIRSGMEYVPRVVRERYMREQEEKRKIGEIEEFTNSMLKNSLTLSVEELNTKLKSLQDERSINFGQQQKSKLTKEVLEAIQLSRGGAKTLVEALAESRAEKGIKGKSELAKFTEKLLKKAPSTFPSYMGQIDSILQHSVHTPAPLTADLIMSRLKTMRQRSYDYQRQQNVATSSNQQKSSFFASYSPEQEQRDDELYQTLKIIERHPKAHSLSPQLRKEHAEQLQGLINELDALSPHDIGMSPESSSSTNATSSLQIDHLINQKHVLENMLKPFGASTGIQLPADPVRASSFPYPPSSSKPKPRKKTLGL